MVVVVWWVERVGRLASAKFEILSRTQHHTDSNDNIMMSDNYLFDDYRKKIMFTFILSSHHRYLYSCWCLSHHHLH